VDLVEKPGREAGAHAGIVGRGHCGDMNEV
jgi:hypothetical protein